MYLFYPTKSLKPFIHVFSISHFSLCTCNSKTTKISSYISKTQKSCQSLHLRMGTEGCVCFFVFFFHWSSLSCRSQSDQLPPSRVHHGCWLLHSSHPGEVRPELSGDERGPGGEGTPHTRKQKRTRTQPRNKPRPGEQRPPRPCWPTGSFPFSFLHALPLPLAPLGFWGSCYRPAEHGLEGKKTMGTSPVEQPPAPQYLLKLLKDQFIKSSLWFISKQKGWKSQLSHNQKTAGIDIALWKGIWLSWESDLCLLVTRPPQFPQDTAATCFSMLLVCHHSDFYHVGMSILLLNLQYMTVSIPVKCH